MVKILFFSLLVASTASYSLALPKEGKAQKTVVEKQNSIIGLPFFFYTPETKIAGGALVNYIHHVSEDRGHNRPSTIMPSLIYTQKKQIMTELITDIYWKNDSYNLKTYTSYAKYPDSFYGIGNNTLENMEENYTAQKAKLEVDFKKKIYSGLHIGIQYNLIYSKLVEVEEKGLLARGDIVGSKKGTSSGVGFLVNWDTRNNIFYPSSGQFFQLREITFGSVIGSQHKFTKYNIDLRHYFSPFSSHIMVLQSYMDIVTNNPPFELLSLFGGSERMRGYYEGRYRDKNMMVFQMEYRVMPVWWRFGLVGFVGFGDVSNRIRNFKLRDFKYSAGGGIRYLFNREEKMNLRLDFGYGKNSSGMYITIGEAF